MDIPLVERGTAVPMAKTVTSRFISFYHFALLIWKGFLLRKRHYIVTAIELFIPILISSIPVMIYAEFARSAASYRAFDDRPMTQDPSRHKNATCYQSFDPRASLSTYYSSSVYIIFTPNTSLSLSLTHNAVDFWKEKANVKIKSITGMRTESDLEDDALKIQINDKSNYIIVGLVYSNFPEDGGALPDSLQYKIRYGQRYGRFNTDSKYPPFSIGPGYDDVYSSTYFLGVQASVDHTFINMHANRKGRKMKTEVMMQKFPYPPYDEQSRGFELQDQAGMFFCFGFIVLNIIAVKRVIDEKSNRSKELLKMMGMTDCIYWSSTFMNFYLISFVKCVIMTILYKVEFYGYPAFMPKADPLLLFILLMMISANILLFCFFITSFINRSVVGIVILVLTWMPSASLLSAFLFAMNKYFYLNLSSRLAVCLLPTGATLVVFRFVGVMESSGAGAIWFNIARFIATPDQNLLMVMGMILASCLMYCFLTWYIGSVWPWQYGVPQPFYFPFTKSYWLGRRNKTEEETENLDAREYFEEEPMGTSPGIIVNHLTKEFRSGITTKLAVDDLSMRMYHGQITAVLGHNGAGKTTTINMLTGLYPPSRGTASIDGWDILTQINSARRSLSVCPQHNVLYDTLTTQEHLMLYAGLKGISWSSLNSEALEILRLLKLEDKAKELSKNLSGGMKRKLALGIALIGGSKVLFLDEPTSGMDPEARRSVWDMLLSIRTQRTIVLTTHYMEEADILGDRIAIIADGRIQCYGSPMFLKKKYGTGYHLHLTKEPQCVLEAVTTLLKNYVPEANLENSTDREATYSFLDSDPSAYGQMFEELERQKIKLGIGSFGMSITTMEDVFIKVTQTASDMALQKSGLNGLPKGSSAVNLLGQNDVPSENSRGHNVFTQFPKLEGFPLVLQQIKGLLLKRFHHAKRHWSIIAIKLGYPFFLILMMVWVIHSIQTPMVEKALVLDLEKVYGDSKGFYHYNATEARSFSESYLRTVLQSSGVDAKNVSDPSSFVVKFGEVNLLNYINDLLIGGSATFDNETLKVKAWFNGVPYHTAPMALNVLDTALLRNISNSERASIKLTNAPLSFGDSRQSHRGELDFVKFVAGGFLPTAFAFMSSSFVFVPVYENVSKAKLLQLMTGVSTFMYWSVMFAWDLLVYFGCCLILLLPFAIFDASIYGHSESIGTILLIFLFYGWSSIPLCYLASLVFKKPSTGFGVLTAFKVTTGLISAMVLSIFLSVVYTDPNITTALWFLHLLPTFTATWGLGNVLNITLTNSYCDSIPPKLLEYSCPTMSPEDSMFKCCKDYCGQACFNKTYPLIWEPYGCGREVTFLFIDGIFFFALLILLESHSVRRLFKRAISQLQRKIAITVQPNNFNMLDEDVLCEANRVRQGNTGQVYDEALLVLGLTKYYKSICAVENLNFGVHLEECFGLLGINGAGKTSTFKMLTGDIEPTEGDAFLRDSNLRHSIQKFQSFLGYCPQYDALVDRLSGSEMLTLFARLRGIPETLVHSYVSELVNMVDLQDYSEKPTKVYSGGNKRKLSLALAIVGNPPLILLDEPTSGVDPVARRKIWNVLAQIRTVSGSSIILTTHSMEESEALCSRLAIMVNGQFRCIGSIQHLKSKFGQGFTIVAKLKKGQLLLDPFMMNAKSALQEAFPSASLKDDHQGMLNYHISDTSVTWSHMFNKMEKLKQMLQLDDYHISDTTLEQIFLAFARNQRISAEIPT